ncbi:alginate biosynthesis protein AlgX [Devosia sp. UYZn731]|uniref:alginate O-acetyltransferase AlgX-related protein n=1 Tax=Devosia sp. UYZn731 TaxID=3156345 RepID=UPI00339672CC
MFPSYNLDRHIARQLAALAVGALALLTNTAAGHAFESQFGCRNLDHNRSIPALEGASGDFFRIQPDLRMYFPMTDRLIADLAHLSAVLKAKGTTLVYLPVPPKGMTMPHFLPDEARFYGFDPVVARRIYEDTIAKLRDAGIVTVDLLPPLSNDDPAVKLFFQADFHWTAKGAERVAEAVAKTIMSDSGYAGMVTTKFETTPTGPQHFVSSMRQLLQKSCVDSLPEPVTDTYRTLEVVDAGEAVDIFGNAGADTISLVGTSFSEVPQFNFAGFISQYSGLNVRNLAISGGNQFASISSYLTSKNFDLDRPKYLIWENPVYNNLAQFGDGPINEMIAAVSGGCDPVPANAFRLVADNELSVDLYGAGMVQGETLLADAGVIESREVDLTFSDAAGRVRTQSIVRSPRYRTSGRFYIPISGYQADGFSTLSIRFDRPTATTAMISACPPNQGIQKP